MDFDKALASALDRAAREGDTDFKDLSVSDQRKITALWLLAHGDAEEFFTEHEHLNIMVRNLLIFIADDDFSCVDRVLHIVRTSLPDYLPEKMQDLLDQANRALADERKQI